MVRRQPAAADSSGVRLPPAARVAAVTRRTSLTRRVSAVTRLTTVVALTSTGGIVGAFAREAQEADAAAALARSAPPREVVVASPVARPVRTVVVRLPAVVRRVAQAPAPRSSPAARKARPARVTSSNQGPRPPAPRATQSPPATKTSGS